jgi:excisionase family DNA binding protein
MQTPTQPLTTHPILTLQEVADYLRLPIDTIRRHAILGQIPGRSIDGEWRFLKQAIDQWLTTPIQMQLRVQGKITPEDIQIAQSRSQDLLGLLDQWDTPDQETYQTETWNQLNQNLPGHNDDSNIATKELLAIPGLLERIKQNEATPKDQYVSWKSLRSDQ